MDTDQVGTKQQTRKVSEYISNGVTKSLQLIFALLLVQQAYPIFRTLVSQMRHRYTLENWYTCNINTGLFVTI